MDIAERFVAVFIEGHKPWIYKYETEKVMNDELSSLRIDELIEGLHTDFCNDDDRVFKTFVVGVADCWN